MIKGEEYRYRGTSFIIECKEHINRVAGPGSRNYIIRGILSHGEEIELPESVDGDPVTSFMPSNSFSENTVYPGVKRLHLPGRLGRFLERNDTFPDLDTLEVASDNEIFITDGRMLYRDGGKELCLCLAEGLNRNTVTVPAHVQRLGPFAFADSRCTGIIFENPRIEAEDSSFDRSVWLDVQGPAVYVGDMLYRVKTGTGSGRLQIILKDDIERVNKNAFSATPLERGIKLCIPGQLKLQGLTDAIIRSELNAPLGGAHSGSALITVSRKSPDGLHEKEINVPLSLDPSGTELLRRTLDNNEDHYDEIFTQINIKREKLDYALLFASGDLTVNEALYRKTIESNQIEAARRCAEILDESAFCRLIKRGYIGKDALINILPELQSRGMVNAAASILIM